MKAEPRKGPSWAIFGIISFFCFLGCAVWLGLLSFGSSMSGWSDGSGAYASHFLRDRLPILSFAAIALGFFPNLGRRISIGFIVASFTVYLAFLVPLWPKVGITGLFFGAAITGPLLALRYSIGKEEPNQALEPTAPSGRGSS